MPPVIRVVTLLSLFAALAVGGYLFVAGNRASSPAEKHVTTAVQAGIAEAATVNLQQATAALEQNRELNGTYAGTDLGGFGGVLLVRADESSYCIQSGAGPTLYHDAGPNGAPAAGAC
jgi:hypothetical protein